MQLRRFFREVRWRLSGVCKGESEIFAKTIKFTHPVVPLVKMKTAGSFQVMPLPIVQQFFSSQQERRREESTNETYPELVKCSFEATMLP